MKNVKNTFLLISFISLMNISCAHSNAVEPDEQYDLTPPADNALHLRKAQDTDKVSVVQPTSWPVRVIYVGWSGLYEFDKQGNVLKFSDKPSQGDLVEYYLNNKPAWTGEQTVYYWRHNTADEIYYDVDVVTEAFVKTKNNIVCPARAVAQDYTSVKLAYDDDSPWIMFLNPECSNAISTKINGRAFLVYPNEAKYAHDDGFSMYWTVQYFNDPITPIYNAQGKCVYACDIKK